MSERRPRENGPKGKGEPEYQVEATESAQAELDRIPQRDWPRVKKDLVDLEKNPRPRNSVKIGEDIYRLRRGDWRIIYRVYDERRYILIGGARRRNERTYKGIEKLFSADS
ncbi:MAG: type II toxin-antitoxin system RelE/ParE family toxin [Chloroflexi bacterium]|nr:type II toxin-antitoxin system RelE/ParE family toxin [Chloroflexota bacterium]